jgi:hypothetical protein
VNEVALRRRLAELLGSAFLTAVVIGSGIAAQHLSPGATGPEPLENAAATAAGLAAIVLTFGPLSGALFNPSGSLSVISDGHPPPSVSAVRLSRRQNPRTAGARYWIRLRAAPPETSTNVYFDKCRCHKTRLRYASHRQLSISSGGSSVACPSGSSAQWPGRGHANPTY